MARAGKAPASAPEPRMKDDEEDDDDDDDVSNESSTDDVVEIDLTIPAPAAANCAEVTSPSQRGSAAPQNRHVPQVSENSATDTRARRRIDDDHEAIIGRIP